MEALEVILNEKLRQISTQGNECSEIHYSLTESNSQYTGVLLLNSPTGRYFATATSDDLEAVNLSLSSQIARQAKVAQSRLSLVGSYLN